MLLYVSLAWLAGIFVGWKAPWPVWAVGLVIGATLVGWGIWERHSPPPPSGQARWPAPTDAARSRRTHWSVPTGVRMPWGAVIGLCTMSFLVAGLRAYNASGTSLDTSLSAYNDKGTAEVRGVVKGDPELKASGLELRLEASEIKVAGEWRPVSGGVLVRAQRFASYSYGDLLQVRGRLETPPRLEGFDYRAYLARQGIGSVVRSSRIEVVESGHGNRLLQKIYSLRGRLARSLAASLPEPQSALAQGILLGLRGDIPKEVNDAFSRSGTTHLLAISGQNITIVVGIVVGLAAWGLGRQRPTYLILTGAVVWLYTFLVGGQPPVVRAAIMASLFLLAQYAGRPGSAPTALALAAAAMVGIDPSALWDVSFQLSFLSMAGLVYLAPHLQSLGQRARLPLPIAVSLAVSLGAILFTWPVIAYDFGRLSLVGLPATALAAPALPIIMSTSAAAAGLGLLAAPLGLAVGWVAWLPLSYLLAVAKGFAAAPSASLPVQSFPAIAVAGYYGLLVVFIVGAQSRQVVMPLRAAMHRAAEWSKRRGATLVEKVPWKWATFVLAPVTVLVWSAGLAMLPASGGKLEVSFLDVRTGDAILIRTPARHYILIDGGGDAQSLNVELGKKLPFWQRKLDLVVLTTPKTEHVGGLVEVVERYRVEQVWDVAERPRRPAPAYAEWERRLAKKGITALRAEEGLKLNEGEYLALEVVSAGAESDTAMVLRLRVGEISFLFTSDMGESMERELLARRASVESTVLKVASHGGSGSTSEAFLARVKPSAAVVTASGSVFQQPDAGVIERLQKRVGADRVYFTSKHGGVDFTTDGRRLWVGTER